MAISLESRVEIIIVSGVSGQKVAASLLVKG